MKHPLYVIMGALVGASLQGCIQDALPNIEADILSVTYAEDAGILNVVYVPEGIDLYADAALTDPSSLPLQFGLSEGATISPDPSAVSDYSQPRTFDVTSEDGQWKRSYQVRIVFAEMPTHFGFEHWRMPDGEKYMIPYEEYMMGEVVDRLNIWACGNQPYSFLLGKNDDYTSFPTLPTDDACEGKKAVKLVTRLTGQVDKPIAAGNIFIGQFDEKKRDPLESTMFGLPFTKKPLAFRGKYKYKSGGDTYYSHQPDRCRMQAILYRTDAEVKHLNGYTQKTSANVVARAEMDEGATPTDGKYVDFYLPFVYTQDVDPEVLSHGGYSLAVIFSSSRHGDTYDGAPGSEMCVDDVEIVCE